MSNKHYIDICDLDYLHTLVNEGEVEYDEETGVDFSNYYTYGYLKELYESAESGDIESQKWMATIYYAGSRLVPRDVRAALFWFKKAADNGSESCQHIVGEFYYSDYGTDDDKTIAEKYFRLAADSKYEPSIYQIFCMSYRKKQTEEDKVKNFHVIRQLAIEGYGPAQYSLHCLYKFGYGTKKNCELYVFWLFMSALHELDEALNYIAVMFAKGIYFKKNIATQYAWKFIQEKPDKDFHNYNGELLETDFNKAVSISNAFRNLNLFGNHPLKLNLSREQFNDAHCAAQILAILGFSPSIHKKNNIWIVKLFQSPNQSSEIESALCLISEKRTLYELDILKNNENWDSDTDLNESDSNEDSFSSNDYDAELQNLEFTQELDIERGN